MNRLICRCLWYHVLTAREYVRQSKLLVVHVLIVAGICLPLFILAGLKRGHVQELRQQLVSSPTGRQVIFWSASHGPILTDSLVSSLTGSLPQVDLIIPEVRAVVTASSSDDGHSQLSSLTLTSTLPEDPILAQHETLISDASRQEVILSEYAATELRVEPGDNLLLQLHRRGDVSRSVPFQVIGIVPGNENSSVGFTGVSVLNRIQNYLKGYAVPEWDLPSKPHLTADDLYSEYLLVCRATDDLKDSDRSILSRRYDIRPVDQEVTTSLTGLLSPDGFEELHIYRLCPKTPDSASHESGSGRSVVTERPSEIDRRTSCDEIVIPWNPPRSVRLNDRPARVVGISVAQRKWLARYLVSPEALFTFGDSERQFWSGLAENQEGPVVLSGIADLQISLSPSANLSSASDTAVRRGHLDDEQLPTVYIPAPLLAHLYGLETGHAVYEPVQQIFAPVPQKPRYDKARLYAETIDDVPGIVDQLVRQKFAHYSESTRIEEIRSQDASLELLVQIVTRVVSFFGILTVATVLLDSTARRRKDIGVLRIMGVSGTAVLYMVLLRAFVTGIAAACVSWGLAKSVCLLLRWEPSSSASSDGLTSLIVALKPHAVAFIDLAEDWPIALTAVVCSLAGSLIPAVIAARLDPIEALVTGKESQ